MLSPEFMKVTLRLICCCFISVFCSFVHFFLSWFSTDCAQALTVQCIIIWDINTTTTNEKRDEIGSKVGWPHRTSSAAAAATSSSPTYALYV